MGIRIDPGKRIDVPSQVARALVGIPDVRDTSRLSASSRELLHRIAEAGGALRVPTLPAGLEPLLARGVVFGRKVGHGIELVLPTAFLLQLKSWEGEDPRALRALLAQAPFETLSAVASHYLGRPANPPIALSLEAAWEQLSDPARLRAEIEKVPPVERKLLESIESGGGEVDTQELLDLEREPLRVRGAGGVNATRRGAGFSLERRAFLIPIHPNRHVIPTEVAQIVGADRRQARELRRAGDPHLRPRGGPRPPPRSLRVGPGLPRRRHGLLRARAGQRGARRRRDAALAPGQAVAAARPRRGRHRAARRPLPRGRSMGSDRRLPRDASRLAGDVRATQILFSTWRRGGAWDEARPEREVLRVAESSRDASPIGALREMVIDALQDLGEGRWVPWHSLEGYLAADERVAGIERLLRRWADRAGVEPPDVLATTRRIALETLPALGIIDLGGAAYDGSSASRGAGSADSGARAAAADGDGRVAGEHATLGGLTVRLTPRGRALLAGSKATVDPTPSKFVDTHALRVGQSARIAHVLGLAPFAELGRVGDQLDVLLTPQAIARALSAGLEGDSLRARIELVAPLPDTISRMLIQASAIIGRAAMVQAAGFLWVDDAEVRELLRTRRPACSSSSTPRPRAGSSSYPTSTSSAWCVAAARSASRWRSMRGASPAPGRTRHLRRAASRSPARRPRSGARRPLRCPPQGRARRRRQPKG